MSRLTLCFAVMVLLAAAGCKNDLVPAGGTLTQKKVPVADATVMFHYPDGNFAVGTTDAKGRYSLNYLGKDGTKPGEKIGVTVTKRSPSAQSVTLPPLSGPPAPGTSYPSPTDINKTAPANVLPPEFGDPKNPKLTFDIPAGGSDKLDIDLP